jgi:hypothetical protein
MDCKLEDTTCGLGPTNGLYVLNYFLLVNYSWDSFSSMKTDVSYWNVFYFIFFQKRF